MIETERLKIYPAGQKTMEKIIFSESDPDLKQAYLEMLRGAQKHPTQWDWYAIWMIELKDGTYVGSLSFKGLNEDGSVEIGYGIEEHLRCKGYATEAVHAAVLWALKQPGVDCVIAETADDNAISRRVLAKIGFIPMRKRGEEGPLFVRRTCSADL